MIKHSSLHLSNIVGFIIMLAVFILVSVSNVTAKEYPFLYQGIRPLGMGGAFTAVSDDENALFFNPAGLSKISKFNIGLINPIVEISKKSIDLIEDAQDTDMDDTGEVADLLRKYAGKHQHLRIALYPYASFNVAEAGVMIGVLGQGRFDAEIRNPAWPEVYTDIIGDVGVLTGAGLKLPLTGLRAGVAVKYIFRKSLSEVYTAADIASKEFEDRLEDDMKTGSGISADIGVMYDVPFVTIFDTTAALVAQNIPEMKMGNAVDIKTQFNAGMSIKKSFTGFSILGAVDYRDFTYNIGKDNDTMKRIHVGAELKLPKIFSLRAGLNQGYYTAGATLNFKVLKLDFATYGEEMGAHAGQREDRRYIGQITLGW